MNPTEAADEKEVLLTNHLIKNWRGCENTVWHLERNKIGNIEKKPHESFFRGRSIILLRTPAYIDPDCAFYDVED